MMSPRARVNHGCQDRFGRDSTPIRSSDERSGLRSAPHMAHSSASSGIRSRHSGQRSGSASMVVLLRNSPMPFLSSGEHLSVAPRPSTPCTKDPILGVGAEMSRKLRASPVHAARLPAAPVVALPGQRVGARRRSPAVDVHPDHDRRADPCGPVRAPVRGLCRPACPERRAAAARARATHQVDQRDVVGRPRPPGSPAVRCRPSQRGGPGARARVQRDARPARERPPRGRADRARRAGGRAPARGAGAA